MKTVFAVAALSAALCSPAYGQSNDENQRKEGEALMRIEKGLLDALLKGDSSPFERDLGKGYVSTSPDGAVQDKAQFIADIKSGDLKLQSATLDDAKVNVYGNAAIVTFASVDKGTYKGKDISGNTRWTDVFIKQNGRWQIVATHGSRVMKP